ncbi:hypothetical protein BMS3Bbin08_00487 [bacterium BMS3Bbin08]|nr:hypothetical protein BMS3Bbin08_00487 [bacterium BMS3Bbin08]
MSCSSFTPVEIFLLTGFTEPDRANLRAGLKNLCDIAMPLAGAGGVIVNMEIISVVYAGFGRFRGQRKNLDQCVDLQGIANY